MWYEFDESNTKVIIKHPRTIGVRWIRNEEVPSFLKHPDKSPNLTLTKTDENGTKYYKTDICPICGGNKKVYLGVSDNNDYTCNKCSGTGKLKKAKTYKIHSHEYGIILEQEYTKNENKKFYESYGVNEDGTTYVYIGNTYPIKDELKDKGAKFDRTLYKWHSRDLIEGYSYIKVTIPLKTYSDGSVGYDFGRDEKDFNIRLNSLLDDVLREIEAAEKNLNSN